MYSKKTHKFFIKPMCIFMVLTFLAFLCTALSPANNVSAASYRGRIVIDPGHDSYDTGAIGCNGVLERDVNAQLAYRLACNLRSDGFEVYLTHPINYAPGVGNDFECILPDNQGRYKYPILESEGQNSLCGAINRKDPDLAISVHHNAASSLTAQGLEVFWRSSGNNSANHEKSRNLGQWLVDNCKNVYTNVVRNGGRTVDNLYKICRNNVPTVLFETGFITTPSECDKSTNPHYQQLMANSMQNAVSHYINVYPSKHRPPTPKNATVENIQAIHHDDKSSIITVIASGVQSENGISSVKFPTYAPGDNEATWRDGVCIGDNTWAYTYDGSDRPGKYNTHVYAVDSTGHMTGLGAADPIEASSQKDNEQRLFYVSTDASKNKFVVLAQNVTDPSGINKVLFPTFAPNSSDPVWETSAHTGSNTYSRAFKASDYNVPSGEFNVHAYKFANSNPDKAIGIGSLVINSNQNPQKPVIEVKESDDKSKFTITVSKVNASEVRMPTWNDNAGQDKTLIWHKANRSYWSIWTCEIPISSHGSYPGH